MKFKMIACLWSALILSASASALQNSPLIRHLTLGTGFGAPTISGKDNVSPKSEGDLVYDSLDGIFFGYDGTNWNALSVGVASGTSSYHTPTAGQIVYDTSAGAFKGYNGTGWITFNSSTAGVPAGTVITTARTSCPTGYIAADGTSILRTGGTECGGSGCDNLFAAIGTTYGTADGSHFTLPNAKGVFIRGAGSQTILGKNYTGSQGTAENDEFASHTHLWYMNNNPGPNTSTANASYGGAGGNGSYTGSYGSTVQTTAAGSGSETQPANITLLYCIAY